jgi:hypothetical protein
MSGMRLILHVLFSRGGLVRRRSVWNSGGATVKGLTEGGEELLLDSCERGAGDCSVVAVSGTSEGCVL